MNFVVLLSKDKDVQIIGSVTGGPMTEERANKLARAYQGAYPRLGVLVVPITALSVATVPLAPGNKVLGQAS